MKYYFETYGCQMNVSESGATERILQMKGWGKAKDAEDADMVIINTCSVRQTAEQRVIGRLGYYTALKKERDASRPLFLVVMGCMAERIGGVLSKDYPIDFIVGNFEKQYFPSIIEAAERGEKDEYSGGISRGREHSLLDTSSYFPPISSVIQPNGDDVLQTFSSYVPIMHGCNNFCTYCIVPYVRGREVSRPVKEILNEADTLINSGVKEITLLGQNVNSYRDGDADFASLLRLISSLISAHKTSDKGKKSDCWVRFLSSHPKDFTDSVIEAIAECPEVCRHIHLPVQSGSDSILRAMNRHYTRADYLSLVRRIRSYIDGVSLTTDIMVGFPGETERDFEDVLSLMDEVRYENAFMYYYNVREGTRAAKMEGQLPIEVKKERLKKVIDRQLEITEEVMARRLGNIEKALVEGVSRDDKTEALARTEHDERVAVGGLDIKKSIGHFINVRLTSLNGHTYKGTVNE